MSAPIRVMIVDDSAVVRGLFDRALHEDTAIHVVASAANGEIAVSMLSQQPVDVIILDVEMPVMDGLTALPKLLAIAPKVRIIMSSTLTTRNAEISLRAMQMGAADYIAKPSTRDTGEVGDFYRSLIAKIKALAPYDAARAQSNVAGVALPAATPAMRAPATPSPSVRAASAHLKHIDQMRDVKAVAIASSTGGPQALLHIFREFKGMQLRVPVFITQHMPANFTAILADHLAKASGLNCHEAVDGEAVEPGMIYVAPGDYHMLATREGAGSIRIALNQNPPENFCRPSADPMLRSLAKLYNDKLLTLVLTGLGTDGTLGAKEVVAAGGIVTSQDEASSVVYGMPKAVAEAKLSSAVFSLNEIAPFLIRAAL